ncbi:MAG: hypothetical protein A2622_04425 [Bdellovibrionales bacterium RIFCSPHIGHO2_01_FULL_40_29]|nr:MAG: hypothetical protein A2622_04425 [Bdellovibrionales bacterium RIFCSPHIGHO2_01_FULL_40_29]OFZ34817.1 MAG: hypothetical protein A3D17_10950 [Bdellovibrionales bacterium RIFCSPHIGHO2_02_FULL_40_15]
MTTETGRRTDFPTPPAHKASGVENESFAIHKFDTSPIVRGSEIPKTGSEKPQNALNTRQALHYEIGAVLGE